MPLEVSSSKDHAVSQGNLSTDEAITNQVCTTAEKPTKWTSATKRRYNEDKFEVVANRRWTTSLSDSPPVTKINKIEGMETLNPAIQSKK